MGDKMWPHTYTTSPPSPPPPPPPPPPLHKKSKYGVEVQG